MADDPSHKKALPAAALVDPTRVPRPARSAIRAEREATIARLQDHVAADHLELDELEERLDLAMQARDLNELRVLTEDLPAVAPSAATLRVVEPRHLPAVVESSVSRPIAAASLAEGSRSAAFAIAEEGEALSLTCIFSGHHIEGRRVLPREIRVRAIFGGAMLDLRESTFLPGTTTIHVKATFGGVHVMVPPHVRVECTGTGIFGAFHADNRSVDGALDSDDMPVLKIDGRAVFGGVHAERKRVRVQRRELRALPKKSG